METTITKVAVGKLISSTDRKYGGEGNIDTLAQSIKEHGLIHPLAVKEAADKKGFYKVIAGRRRFEAIKSLGWKTVDVIVHGESAKDEEIALAENVNREDMHPLDEAETFKRQLDQGMSVEETAKYYSRSISGIYQRIRLTDLIDGIKTMFRDGKINLAGAALVASLPEEDQEKFVKKFGNKHVEKWDIESFIHSVQKFKIGYIADEQCAACKKRTHNSMPGLFDTEDEISDFEDVCFDSECYCEKWKVTIAKLLAKENKDNTENKIFFDSSIPKFLPKSADAVTIADVEYAILSNGKYTNHETTKKVKSKTAWLVGRKRNHETRDYYLAVSRVEYKEFDRNSNGSGGYSPDPVKGYLLDQVSDIKPEEQKTIAAQLEKKGISQWDLKNKVKTILLNEVIERRIKESDNESLAYKYLVSEWQGNDDKGKHHEIDPEYQSAFTAIFDKTTIADIAKDPLIQKVCLFFTVCELEAREMPDLDDGNSDWTWRPESMFWKFSGLGKEEYIKRYKEILDETVKKAVSNQEKARKESPEPEDDDTEDPAGEE